MTKIGANAYLELRVEALVTGALLLVQVGVLLLLAITNSEHKNCVVNLLFFFSQKATNLDF
jgi:hypothetical protein